VIFEYVYPQGFLETVLTSKRYHSIGTDRVNSIIREVQVASKPTIFTNEPNGISPEQYDAIVGYANSGRQTQTIRKGRANNIPKPSIHTDSHKETRTFQKSIFGAKPLEI
jgi:hypothetical protein